MRRALASVLAVTIGAAVASAQARPDLVERLSSLTRESVWTRAGATALAFPAHHPQGLVKIGDTFFLSAVEIKTRTRRFPEPVGGFDRDTGEGVGHLLKFDAGGKLLSAITLGEGTIYHPGGIDFDGAAIWAPVAEYRPNSRSIVYRVDPATMKATEVLRVADHIGAIVRDREDGSLHGVSWGSRRFYRWTLDSQGRVTNAGDDLARLRRLNPSHYVDYQDCKYAGGHRMVCTGLSDLRRPPDGPSLRLGGLDVVDLRDGRPLHQVPVLLWTAGGLAMTQNAAWLEPSDRGVRAWFVPEDDAATLYVYDVNVR